MTDFGYTMMCEQSRPDRLVGDLCSAERAGFDFSVISDHYAPWLEEQGHAGYAWSILGAAAHATERIGLMTYVTCPILSASAGPRSASATRCSALGRGRAAPGAALALSLCG